MNAGQAREVSNKARTNSAEVDKAIVLIKQEAESGKKECRFKTSDEGHLSQTDYDYLRSYLGYEVYWNNKEKAYDISW